MTLESDMGALTGDNAYMQAQALYGYCNHEQGPMAMMGHDASYHDSTINVRCSIVYVDENICF